MKKLLTIVFTMAFIAVAGTAMAAVETTPHDYRTSAAVNKGLCNMCHIPHAAKASERIWVATTNWNQAGTSWAQSNIGQLCGLCHHTALGTITSDNSAGNDPHKTENSAYHANSHGRNMGNLGNTGADPIGDTAADVAGRPYLDKTNMECTSCHDPHDNTVPPFLRNDGTATMDTITEVCTDCHDRSFSGTFGTGNETTRTIGQAGSMHPANVAYVDANGNEGIASYGTVLRTFPASMDTAIDAADWQLGGKRTAGGDIGCQTCHEVHGTNDVNGGTNVAPDNIYLLAINNNGDLTNAPLCEACHGGGIDGQTDFTPLADGRNGAANAIKSPDKYYVGTSYSYLSNGQNADDHPIDLDPDGAPLLDNWIDVNNTRFERTSWNSRTAGDPASAAGNWPMGGFFGSYTSGSTEFGRIVCISCHSGHNGITQTSLRRKGGIVSTAAPVISTSEPTSAEMTANGDAVRSAWCFNCHPSAAMVPPYHHSTTDTAGGEGAGGNAVNYDSGDMLGAGSSIGCGDCHASSGPLQAHNGFFNLNVGASGNASSELCANCHSSTDPVAIGGGYTDHGGNSHTISDVVGTGSHWIGTFAEGGTLDVNVKRGYWRQVPYKSGTATVYSKYGDNAPGHVDSHQTAAPDAKTASQTVICESCHSVLFNAGWDGRASVNDWESINGGNAKWNLEGGWKVNLLLQLYEDRAQGVGDRAQRPVGYSDGQSAWDGDVDQTSTGPGFCIQCHNNAAKSGNWATGNGLVTGSIEALGTLSHSVVPRNMHPMTGWTITRAEDSGRTTGNGILLETSRAEGSYADADSSPDIAGTDAWNSYPGDDKMDCDSCHTPHNAMTNGNIMGQPRTSTGADDTVPSIVHETNLPVIGAGRDHDDMCLGCHNR